MIEGVREEKLSPDIQLEAYKEYALDNPAAKGFVEIQNEGGFTEFAVATLLYKRLKRLEGILSKNSIQELPAIVEPSEVYKDMVIENNNVPQPSNDGKERFRQRIAFNLQHHPPQDDSIQQKHEKARALTNSFAMQLIDIVPASDEMGVMLRKIEEVLMWANAAIARNQ